MSPMIVAEIGGNHLGDYHRALRLINAAFDSGADAVKLQCFTPEQMVDPDTVIQSGPWAGRNALELYRETHTPREWFPKLFDYAKEQGIAIFSSVFHPDDVDFLETLGCPQYKVASFEITDLALIKRVAKTGKPIILSTGMASFTEINHAQATAIGAGARCVTLLKCTSSYPAPLDDCNLTMIPDMRNMFDQAHLRVEGCHVGLSDHTLGHTAAVVATALGATMIEKHLTLSRQDGGPDAAFSAEPNELRDLVNACREAHQALGTVHYGPTASEADSLALRRRANGMRGAA